MAFPEKQCNTTKFDNCGQSHHLMHVFVLIGIAIGIVESMQLYEERRQFQCPAGN